MKDIDPIHIENIIRYVAADEIMPRFQNLRASDIREKSPGDLVTVADEAAETALTKLLSDALPGSTVVGEEAVSANAAVLQRLKGDAPVWVIDPIDGTRNFSNGNPQFGVFVALVQNGAVRAGWAYDAPGNRMAVAQQGAGAWLEGKRITLSTGATDIAGLKGLCDGAPAAHFNDVRGQFAHIGQIGCCLHDYMNLYTGAVDFVAYVDRITPWDHAAVSLITQEAGGVFAQGGAGAGYDPSYYGRGFLLSAANDAWWQKLNAILYPLRTW